VQIGLFWGDLLRIVGNACNSAQRSVCNVGLFRGYICLFVGDTGLFCTDRAFVRRHTLDTVGNPDNIAQGSNCKTMRWLRLVASLKLQVSFAEYSPFCRALLHR